jgi:hypothetical protein
LVLVSSLVPRCRWPLVRLSAGGLHYFTANAQGAILKLYNQSAPTRHEHIYANGYIFICVRGMMYANAGAARKVIGNVSFCCARGT